MAALRLDRGSERFLRACTAWLGDRRVRRILSPPLARAQAGMWRRAGFDDHLELVVFERNLSTPSEAPLHPVVRLESPDVTRLAAIDDRAFDPTWRVGRAGLEDALNATHLSVTLAVVEGDTPLGFAILGELAGTAYLQRLSVEPSRGRLGIGRSLVRESMRWARKVGARSMLLNTQPDNQPAAALYRSEGFVGLGTRLQVLARKIGS